ncbi:MAG: transposase [Candidatus Sungbacteria bacterium]|nr:transposase [Candidatus Sungbacteria bacterium]
MPRQARVSVADVVYHVINRANGRQTIFHNDKDYRHFETLLEEAVTLTGMRLHAYCIMPNHWHLVLFPSTDTTMSEFMSWLTLTHSRQYRTRTQTIGHGHLYQDRYKSFPVEDDKHCVDLVRYVEQNPLRARLVERAEDWQWGSLYRREKGSLQQKNLLAPLPTELPTNYLESVNEIIRDDSLRDLRYSVNKGRPYGSDGWIAEMVDRFGLGHTTRGAGRPRKMVIKL